MGSIVTFYSYKGGVGRSMAVANVAVLLARCGVHVLVIDWDLESPGLDRYFVSLTTKGRSKGVLALMSDAADGLNPDYRDYVCKVFDEGATGSSFDFLSSGCESDAEYAVKLQRFEWRVFFEERGGGAFIEKLREDWRKEFQIVLIDGHTGLSDAGGICTIQLPDTVVAVFTANHQSLYGVRNVMRLAQRARQTLAYDRMPLTILPVPSRFVITSQYKESEEWMGRFEEALGEFYADWLPKLGSPRVVLERIKVPQMDYFGFDEKLAVIEQGISDPKGLGFVYNMIADLLANDFGNVERWLGLEYPTYQT